MTVTEALIKALCTPTPPPHGWLNELPEAFAAVDDQGDVTVIGYKGEWYVPVKPSLRTRLRNWLICFDEVEPDANPEDDGQICSDCPGSAVPRCCLARYARDEDAHKERY